MDCVIMESIDDELEDEVLWRVVNRSDRNMSVEVNGTPQDRYDADLARAMRLTGGYVAYLRENARELLSRVYADEASLRRCLALGKFVAYMRARPSKRQDETAEREFAARLVGQMVRLAKCTAAVIGRDSLDGEPLERTTRVALDTARGRSLELARVLQETGRVGATQSELGARLHDGDEKLQVLLAFLRRIGVVDRFAEPFGPGGRGGRRYRYRLHGRIQKLYAEVYGT